MKKITLAVLVLFGFALNAQIYYYVPATAGNPGTLNADPEYPVGGGLPATWAVVLGPSQPAAGTWSAAQTIPFSFSFNGIAQTQYKVSSTGVLTFDLTAASVPGSTPAVIPSASIPDKSLMVWGITGTGASDQIVSKTFGTAPNRQHWVFFSSYTMTGQSSSWSYWSIVLEESTNHIYFVDQRNANGTLSATVGVQINGTTAYSVAGSPSLGHLSANDPTSADNFHYAFLPGPQPMYDVTGSEVVMPDFLTLPTAPFSVKGKFMNLGTATITSATINYSINGGAAVSAPLTGLNLTTYGSATLTHPTTWNPAAGAYTVQVWLSNLNGNADANTGNDKASKSVSVVANATQRYPLYETFTSSTCPPCVPANITMEGIFDNDLGGHVSLKYQMSWPGTGDPYYTAEGGVRRTFYSVSSVPNVAIDGGWNDNGNSLTQALYNSFKAVPSFVTIASTYAVNGNTKTVTGTVTINPLTTVSGANLRLFVAIKEKRTTKNVKSNGETEFFNVMKKMIPDAGGEALSGMTAGTPINKTFSYTFNGNYTLPPNATAPIDHAVANTVEEYHDLGVVVWIQDMTTKQVYQAADATRTSYINVDELEALNYNLAVYPNPAAEATYVSLDMDHSADASVAVVNTLGQVVLSKVVTLESGNNKVELNTANLAAGVYFVNVTVEGSLQTVKLSVR